VIVEDHARIERAILHDHGNHENQRALKIKVSVLITCGP
jgi:hypothetical protein